MSDKLKDDDLERIKKATQALGEHFDSVQIFCTRHEAFKRDGTVNVNYGEGNWFTRFGQVRDWVIRQDERTRDHVREEQQRDREG